MKKELREAFERDSKAVTLCESQYPDINVITGNNFTCFSSSRVVPCSSCTFERVKLCFELSFCRLFHKLLTVAESRLGMSAVTVGMCKYG